MDAKAQARPGSLRYHLVRIQEHDIFAVVVALWHALPLGLLQTPLHTFLQVCKPQNTIAHVATLVYVRTQLAFSFPFFLIQLAFTFNLHSVLLALL